MVIDFLPKQTKLYNEILNGNASVIGFGGGRGASKSRGIDSIILDLLAKQKKYYICCIMRNSNQITTFHIDALERNFPEVKSYIKHTFPAHLTIGNSSCDFGYGDSVKDVEKNFRSGNFDLVFIDQAEQFTEDEVTEIRKACRSTSGKKAKLILSFNMRGGGISWLRKWFLKGEVNDPNDYKFIKVNPWDNVYWCIEALTKEGFTMQDYYRWTDEQRKSYAATKGDYTKLLANDNEAIRKADWEGSWDTVEGTYFSEVWDLENTRITKSVADSLRKDWSTLWISQDWGRAHNCVTYWHSKTTLSPQEANFLLGWNLSKPVSLIVTYRELVANNLESPEYAQLVVNNTPKEERGKIKSFYLSPDAFGVKDSLNTIAISQSEVMRSNGMPNAFQADWERKNGWALMGKLLKAAKGRGYYRDVLQEGMTQANEIWLISNDCPNLLESIPMLMRDPKDIEDVEKTDKSSAKLDQDCTDAARYGLKSMLAPRRKTKEDALKEQFEQASPEQRMLISIKRYNEDRKKSSGTMKPSWKR